MTCNPSRIFAAFTFLGLLSSPTSAYLENGEALVNNEDPVTGSTTSTAEALALSVSDGSLGSAAVTGPMNAVQITASGAISDTLIQSLTQATGIVDFVDSLFVTAEGIPDGTDLIVEVGWATNGVTTDIDSPGTSIPVRSRILLEADGLMFNPEDPIPPKQQWTRDNSNVMTPVLSPPGLITFEYLVKAGTIQPDNISLRAAAGIACGGVDPRNYPPTYSASATAEFTVNLFGVTNVKTVDGTELYRWQTSALSGLNYRSRDDDPPSNPTLTVTPSAGGSKLSSLSWDTVATEFYQVQSSPDGTNWTTITEVLGTGNPVSIDVFNDNPANVFRLVSAFGSGIPGNVPLSPALCVTRNPSGDVLIAWQTNHWENYVLNAIDNTGNKTLVQPVSGDGGVFWTEMTPGPSASIFQVEAVLK